MVAASANSQEFETSPETLQPGWLLGTARWLEEQRYSFSDVVVSSAKSIDAYLAREHFDDSKTNSSYVKLQLRERFDKGGERTLEADIKAKLNLPNTKKRVKITFESSSDDFESLSDRDRDRQPGTRSDNRLKESAAAGIQWERYLGRNWDSVYNIGMKLKLPFNPFVRAGWVNTAPMSAGWHRHFRQRFSYFHNDGWKSETRQNFYRPLTEALLFQSSSAAQYLDKTNTWELLQSFSVHQRLSQNSEFEHQVGVSGFTRPNTQTSQYWLRTEFRHRLYKDWIFGKIAPELNFPREDSFKLNPSLYLELEIYFGHQDQ